MEVIRETPKGASSKTSPVRKAATRREPEKAAQRGSRSRGNTLLWVIVALMAGFGVGAFWARQRNRARENDVVFAVNGVTIRKPEFYRRLEMAVGNKVARQMEMEELRWQYAKHLGVAPSDAEVEKKYAEVSKQPNFAQNLEASNLTVEEYKHNLRNTLAETATMSKGVQVTEAEILAFYKKNADPKNLKARYYRPETIQIAVIVTDTEAKCKKALQALASGIPFAQVAKDNSQDRSKANGGILPPTPRGRTNAAKIPGLEDAIFRLKVNERMGPKKFAGAWWIIQCLQKEPEKTIEFKDVKEECRTGALLLKGIPANAQKAETGFEEFVKKANVQAFWSQYKNALNTK